jgi:hypothetical protein
MAALLMMENTFRGPLAPGYSGIINLTVNNRRTRHRSFERLARILRELGMLSEFSVAKMLAMG